MRTLLVAWAASTILGGCATREAQIAPPAVAASAAETTAPAPVPRPKPQYGTFGFDAAGMDRSIAPGDNFYQFANGTWAKNTPIPADKSNYGSFNVLDDLSRERTHQIIEDQAQDPQSRIGNAYASFMDQAAIDSKGLTPFEPGLNQVRAIKSRKNLAELYSGADRLG